MPYREAILTTVGPAGRRILAITRSELVGLELNALEMSYYHESLVNSMKFADLVVKWMADRCLLEREED